MLVQGNVLTAVCLSIAEQHKSKSFGRIFGE